MKNKKISDRLGRVRSKRNGGRGVVDSRASQRVSSEATEASWLGSPFEPPPSPQPPPDSFSNLLKELQSLHDKKKADYAKRGDRFSNFRIAAEVSGIKTFQSIENLIGVKQARLLELRNSLPETRVPNNEGVRDTLIDRAVYSILAVLFFDEEEE